jgi:glycosyltransferase involved in cell wall biosynthesis
MERVRKPYEIIFVDDASTDRSFDLLANLVETDPRLKVIRLRRNFGQTAALAAGFDEAQGTVIISLDGDLQHAPEDIPALLEKIDEGYDIASGWRKNRLDNAVTRKIPSRIANWLMARVSHVELRDFGTTFKAYRAEVLKDVISTASCIVSSPRWPRSTELASPKCPSAIFPGRAADRTTAWAAPFA